MRSKLFFNFDPAVKLEIIYLFIMCVRCVLRTYVRVITTIYNFTARFTSSHDEPIKFSLLSQALAWRTATTQTHIHTVLLSSNAHLAHALFNEV